METLTLIDELLCSNELQLKDIDPMIFAGTRDQNIKLIENNFSSKIVLRGNELYLDGKKNELIIVY